jgi:hypothetical protein
MYTKSPSEYLKLRDKLGLNSLIGSYKYMWMRYLPGSVQGMVSPGIKGSGREADYSPPSSTDIIKNAWSTPPIRLHGMVLN